MTGKENFPLRFPVAADGCAKFGNQQRNSAVGFQIFLIGLEDVFVVFVADAGAAGADKIGVRVNVLPAEGVNLGHAHGHEGKKHGDAERVVFCGGDELLDFVRLQPVCFPLFAGWCDFDGSIDIDALCR